MFNLWPFYFEVSISFRLVVYQVRLYTFFVGNRVTVSSTSFFNRLVNVKQVLVWLQFATALLSIHVVILRTLIKQMPKILNWEIFAKENAFLTDFATK